MLQTSEAAGRELSLEQFHDSSEIVQRLATHGAGVDAVMLGPELEQPLQIAQRVTKADEDLAVLVLAHPGRLERVRAAIKFTPFLGADVLCCSVAENSALAADLQQAITLTRQRRAYRRMVSAAQSHVTTLAPPQPQLAQLLDRLMLHAPIGVVVVDDQGQIVDLNHRAQGILGIQDRRAVGTPLRNRFPETRRADIDSYIRQSQVSGDPLPPRVFTLGGPAGSSASIELRAAVVQGRADNQFLMLILQDVTERERLEREREQFTETLEQRVAERTRDLAVAKSALEQSNEELQQFAYVASHDLQTPLRSIGTFAQFLQQDYTGKLDQQADQYIDRLVGGVKRMKGMIDDLLAYSRVESRSVPFQRVNLNQVCDDVVALMRPSIDDVGGHVTRDDLPSISGDPSQLAHLLQNLIGNGIKYHADRPPLVHVSAEYLDPTWTLAVSDNGIGIEPKYHDQIFEIFRRLHTEQQYPGTGIGLALCRRIVHRHGGTVRLESTPGQGSTFYVTFPTSTNQKE